MMTYRGRLAPSPTGYLHLGHARTFWVAHQRARDAGGQIVFRNEDLDSQRARPEFVQAMYDDLRWLGLTWDEGPDIGGPFAPYDQSRRRAVYLAAWQTLRDRGFIYPCSCSRKDLERALEAPHEDDLDVDNDQLLYPGTCRSKIASAKDWSSQAGVSWRFKVPDGETVLFDDLYFGPQHFIAGKDFSDFSIWRRDDIPSVAVLRSFFVQRAGTDAACRAEVPCGRHQSQARIFQRAIDCGQREESAAARRRMAGECQRGLF